MTEKAGIVVLPPLEFDEGTSANDHEWRSRYAMAERLAALLGFAFGGVFDPAEPAAGKYYFVPGRTLLREQADRLGITRPADLFGGVVSSPFAATKSITHSLISADAHAPPGWNLALPAAISDVVLPGFTIFHPGDAARAAQQLLAGGPIRVKLGQGVGGLGQRVIAELAELRQFLAELPLEQLACYGAVIEPNLEEVETFSVGTAEIGPWHISYHGRQRQTHNHDGELVYGGSDLTVVRGPISALLATTADQTMQQVVEQALRYDAAARAHLPGFFASRRNYDVARGRNMQGQTLCGVLEQSWRIGGASPAEIMALEHLIDQPEITVVQASSHERYCGPDALPTGCRPHFVGNDASDRPLAKYAEISVCGPGCNG